MGLVATTKTRRRHEALSIARRGPRPPGGRGPLGRPTAPNASVRHRGSTQRPALSESAGLASRVDQWFAFEQVRLRRDRRAQARRPGESPTGTDACIRSGRAFHRVPAIIGSPAFPPFHSGQPRQRRHRSLCAFAPLRWVAMDLRHLRDLRADSERPSLCRLCVSVVWSGSGSFRMGRMCGRFALIVDASVLADVFDVDPPRTSRHGSTSPRPRGFPSSVRIRRARASARWCGGAWCRRGPRTKRSGRG